MTITEAALRQFRLLVRPLKIRIANSIASAVISNVNDSGNIQILQLEVLDGEIVGDCERLQEFGFNSVPLDGAEAVVIFPNGDRGNPLVVAVGDRRHRPEGWVAGEAGTFNAFDAEMHHKSDGTTEITGGGAAESLATKAAMDKLLGVLDAWVTAPNDGGAALKALLNTAYSAGYTAAGTSKLKGE